MTARFYGGKLNGLSTDIEFAKMCAKELGVEITGLSQDLSKERAKGLCVHRAELDNQPKFKGYLGPMWDFGGLRYETSEVYEAFSN